ncbi:all-trans retinoic acid-induced differentiation factor isoform X2 [Falco cherrug]|uniref:all-trans retinoic acid-induced differentiation factor isoform X2 n=1 Tax=Falco cherrug TaxID=345164 RepID=UPI0024783472|nr:all-trans retinoic acid-induced differentiation factor isoform X2 [Falco cherrug]
MGAFLLLLLLFMPWAAGGAAVCGHCPGPVQNSSIVAQYCASRAGTESEGRCCWERGARPERLLGDLTENPLTALPNGSFLGFTHLERLAVPLALDCPGGSSAWEEVTTHGSSRLCQGQRNPCNSSRELGMVWEGGAVSPALGAVGLAGCGRSCDPRCSVPPDWPCPDNAACAPDGPGLIQCLCDRPFHGYKCLREGTFPTLLFCGILGAATLSLSLLLWRTQRWKAKTP